MRRLTTRAGSRRSSHSLSRCMHHKEAPTTIATRRNSSSQRSRSIAQIMLHSSKRNKRRFRHSTASNSSRRRRSHSDRQVVVCFSSQHRACLASPSSSPLHRLQPFSSLSSNKAHSSHNNRAIGHPCSASSKRNSSLISRAQLLFSRSRRLLSVEVTSRRQHSPCSASNRPRRQFLGSKPSKSQCFNQRQRR